MSKKKSRKAKKRNNTSLKQHRQQGRTLSPPFMTLPNMRPVNWLQDDFPDMLWLCYVCAVHEERGMVLARKVFDTVEEVLVEEYGDMEKVPKEIWVLGRLTSFDTIPEKLRPKIVERLKLMSIYHAVFPRVLSVALGRYDDPPAEWLWSHPAPAKGYTQREHKEAETALRDTIEKSWSGRNEVSTWAKIAVTSAVFSSGRIHISKEIADEYLDLLPRYPTGLNDDERKSVESRMRAMYLGVALADGDKFEVSKEWAKRFWRKNWELYSCETGVSASKVTPKEAAAFKAFQEHVTEQIGELRQQFLEVSAQDPDLYDPTRHEVLTGIVSRALRAVEVAANVPVMWSTEHGSGLIRGLVEARIVVAWLIHENKPELFKKFQEFGRGHLKLLKLHLEEYLDKQEEPNPELESYVADLDREVNQDLWEEFQEIRVDANFAGNTNTRKMADAVSLGNDYRFIFAPASSTFHGEWTAVEQFALERCLNPLHRGHRVPRKDAGVAMGPQLIDFALDQLADLIERYKGGIDD